MDQQSRPEPMNATTNHSKVKLSLHIPPNQVFIAGEYVSGKMEMECRADKGLGIGIMMVELFAIQELTSRDHSATSTFIHSRRLFQGPGLPPSNAVQAHPLPGDPQLPQHYHQARKGISTFLFRFPLPSTSPSTINFGSNLARVRYELKASVEVSWKDDKRLVTDRKEVDVVSGWNPDHIEEEGTVVGENGKIWAQGRVVGGFVVAGESACVELQVKNHSNKRNTGLLVTLTRTLHLPTPKDNASKPPLQLTDTLVTVPFRGSEYIIPPGAEGVASLVFDVPKHARDVKGEVLYGEDRRTSHSLFEVRCEVGVRITMGLGSKDILLDLPVTIMHPDALPDLPPPPPIQPQYTYGSPHQQSPGIPSPYTLPISPAPPPNNMVWIPPYFSPQPQQHQQQWYFPPPPSMPHPSYAPPGVPGSGYTPPRPASASGYNSTPPRPTSASGYIEPSPVGVPTLTPDGKGERASRIAQHLRMSSRNRSVSPTPVGRRTGPRELPATPPVAPVQRMGNLAPPLESSPIAGPEPESQGTLPIAIPEQQQQLKLSTSFPPQLSPTTGGVLHSPRPVLSPKQSFSSPIAKSERVEDLERMADEVGRRTKDLSGDLPKSQIVSKIPIKETPGKSELDVNKTLPGPPAPTGKPAMPSTSERRLRADVYFSGISATKHEAQKTPSPPAAEPSTSLEGPMAEEYFSTRTPSPPAPKTPTLPPRHRRISPPHLSPPVPLESGLDALEAKLLAQVGTRKPPPAPHPDVRSLLGSSDPVDIPVKKAKGEEDESAISSLTLGACEEIEETKTFRGKSVKSSGDDKGEKPSSGERDKKSFSGHAKRKKGSGGNEEKRSAAKGRVAAWLGGIEPPEEGEGMPPTLTSVAAPVIPSSPAPEPEEVVNGLSEEENKPNPRSSGFVPIGTLKRDLYTRTLVPTTSATVDARRVEGLWASPASIGTNKEFDPPSGAKDADNHNPWKKTYEPSPWKKKSPLLEDNPWVRGNPWKDLNPEVKYDIRSARGGRGGKVTAVKALWAVNAAGEEDKKKPSPSSSSENVSKPLKKPSTEKDVSAQKRLNGRTDPTKMTKSTSLPAVVSSSHAKPTISSTASLARPKVPGLKLSPTAAKPSLASPAKPAIVSPKPTTTMKPTPALPKPTSVSPVSPKPRPVVKVPMTISELPHESPSTTPKPKVGNEGMAFGQARLRDLIRKYQGQA